MAVYTYKARDNQGKSVSGTIEAESDQQALQQLRQNQYTPIKLSQGGVLKAKPAADAQKNVASTQSAPVFGKVRPRAVKISDLMVLCVNLASMVNAGIPLLGALKVISENLTNPYLGDVIGIVSQRVSEGASFSESLSKFPRIFSKYFVSMVRVGEMSGTMDNVLKTLAAHMEQQENMRQKITGALTYPMVLLVAGSGVILMILTFVMPQFVGIFTKSGVPLPLPTQIMYDAGMWIKKFWWALFLGIGVLFAGVKFFLRTKLGIALGDAALLKIPLVGPVMTDMLVARFSRTLASLLNSGVALLQALDILAEVIDNYVFAKIIKEVHDSAEKGEGVHQALKKRKEFPNDVVYMISVGEQSGKMGVMLNKVADFYENRVDYAIKGLLVFIEPVFISFMGVCVGGMLASVILPMFDLVKTIQH